MSSGELWAWLGPMIFIGVGIYGAIFAERHRDEGLKSEDGLFRWVFEDPMFVSRQRFFDILFALIGAGFLFLLIRERL